MTLFNQSEVTNHSVNCVSDYDGPIFFGYFSIVCSVIAIPTNIILIAAVIINRNLRTSTNILMGNIAVINVLYGFIIMPMFAHDTLYKKGLNTFAMCTVLMTLGNWLTGMVLYIFTCIAVMRYIAIVHPLKYQNYFKTSKSIIVQIVICLIIPSIYVFPYYLTGNNVKYGKCLNSQRCHFQHISHPMISFIMWGMGIGMPFLIIVCSYIRVFIEIRRRRHQLKHQNQESGFSRKVTMQSNRGKAEVKMKKREFRLAIITCIIFLIYFLSFIPTAFYRSYESFLKKSLPEPLLYSLLIIYWTSLGLDPLIYSTMNSEFRRVLKNMFKRCFNVGTLEKELSNSTTSQPRSRASLTTNIDSKKEALLKFSNKKGSSVSIDVE